MASSILLSPSCIASISLSSSSSSSTDAAAAATSSSHSQHLLGFGYSLPLAPFLRFKQLTTKGSLGIGGCGQRRRRFGVVRMTPEEQRITRRSPLDFPSEWESPIAPRKSNIFPKFSPMKTPLPIPTPSDPPLEEDVEEAPKEEDQEEEQEGEGEEEVDPEQDQPGGVPE